MLTDHELLLRDEALIERLIGWIEKTVVPYHRASVTGVERVPAGPVLYVGNHNGATYSGDTWILAAALYRHYGLEPSPHGLAHDLAMRIPIAGPLLRRIGCVPADPAYSVRLLSLGRSVMVYPGGDVEALRPYRARDEVRFSGRSGFIRTALRAGVPIVPVAAQGAHATLIVIDDLQGLADALGLHKRFRLKVFPLSLSVPWGLTLGPIPPYMPLPCRMQLEVLDPVFLERQGEEAAADDAYVAYEARRVEALLQDAVTRLAAQ